MTEKKIISLIEESKRIEEELNKAEENLDYIGGLAISIQSFSKSVRSLDTNLPEAQELLKAADVFNKAILRLTHERSKQRNREKEEMVKSKLSSNEEFMENTTVRIGPDEGDNSFFSGETNRVNSLLLNAMDVLDSVKKQGNYITSTDQRIRNGLRRLGLSKELIDSIEKRYSADRIIFMLCVAAVIILFFILRFIL